MKSIYEAVMPDLVVRVPKFPLIPQASPNGHLIGYEALKCTTLRHTIDATGFVTRVRRCQIESIDSIHLSGHGSFADGTVGRSAEVSYGTAASKISSPVAPQTLLLPRKKSRGPVQDLVISSSSPHLDGFTRVDTVPSAAWDEEACPVATSPLLCLLFRTSV
ncbi:RCC1 domain containing protein [Toxoplasma gondii TgCatPRC2]|uniref:RCC1 domain containing protein n=11 Tax=Toxoplasma gondii TaxID=5811 RepID=B9Q3T0_TOXGV|nr:RCC1 domain containing protein [Toxoplasma gondii GT1]ESS29101.1 RCC1 domain containing protein [Toxoplasma gondii VEG]KFG27831.1 RCC1 domain containing protein [Toxoplasma gondii p89]KFG29456.1 RCC1 domain containing protein [Toxoplasma gondii GAB2-2007-GAL-DOM2]KFG32019.1 RCC1 domain containing protein [Toxoplasma gondii FOU]KFG59199.1 RCC1 domain containing protein [Toxoplasma gondii RUB]KFH02519.1 RCC1 domain containing protein [Toxoplasma gondii VAND]KYF44847.1 RCC1 domain containing